MSTQLYDSNGNPIFSSASIGSPDQQVSDSTGNIINPSKEDGNLLSIKTDLDQFTFNSGNLNVKIADGITLEVHLDNANDDVLVYGNDGTTNRKIKTNASGELQVGITNATLAVTQSGTWNINNISGTISLPTGASTETTLSAINAKLVTGTVIGDVNAAQKGTWTTGRTWTLASGTDSILAVQSGTWNINNISGTISLPTGASTEATLSTRLADATFTGRINTLGQKTMANSTPIVIASDQTVIPVSQSGNWSVRLQDGAGTALTSSLVNTRQALDIHQADTSFIVSGLTAVGGTPTLNPVSVAGVDGSGFKRHFLTDASGKQHVNLNDGAGNLLASSTTAPTGSEQALIVRNIIADTPVSGNLTNGSDTVIINCRGLSTVGWTTSGTWTGTMTHEVQYGDGQWFTVETLDTNLNNDGKPFVVTSWTETLNNDPWITNVAGATQLRFKFSSYGSGTATVTINGSVGINATRVYNLTPSILQATVRTQDGSGNNLASATLASVQRLQVSDMPYDTETSLGNKTFVTAIDVTLGSGGTETNALLLKNPNASGKILSIRKIVIHPSTNSNGSGLVKIYADPTISTNGSAATASPTHVGGGGTAVATPFTGPTTSANGARLLSTSYGSGTAGEIPSVLNVDGAITIDANHNLLITGTPSANNINIGLVIFWAEL